MKYAIHILLVTILAMGPWGCSGDQVAPDRSVSANADRAERMEKADPSKTYREPATMPRRAQPAPAENRRAEDRAAAPTPKQPMPAPAKPMPKPREMQNVASGTAITVSLIDALSTETNKTGDTFTASLTEPIVVNGNIVAEKGDKVTGRVKDVEEPGRVKGRARLELVLSDITTSGKIYHLSTEPFTVVGGDSKDRDAAIIAGGAGAGAIIGAVTGGKKGAALGAIIGGGTGTTAVLITKGQQLELKPETRINFVLSDDVNLPVIRTTIR